MKKLLLGVPSNLACGQAFLTPLGAGWLYTALRELSVSASGKCVFLKVFC